MLNYLKIGAGLVVAASLTFAAIYLYSKGRNDARLDVERRNTNAAGRANEAAMSLRDCLDRDGVYHFDTGKCRWTETGNRQ